MPVPYRRYALGLLVAIYTVNFLDRQIVTILIPDIKRDLNLSDSEVGAMAGLWFAILYTTLGIPIARWADRGDRPFIMTASLAVWSGFTVLAGFAQNFLMLAISRAGVGVGEAGCTPTAHSLLTDYFPKELTGRANGALNLFHVAAAFAVQYATGLVVQQWIPDTGHYPDVAYQTAFALIVVFQIAAWIWFMMPRAFLRPKVIWQPRPSET
jgi:MFS family permease